MLFGEWLVKEGLVTVEQVQRALQLQTVNGGRLGTNLVLRGALEIEALIEALGAWSGVEAATIQEFEESEPRARALVNEALVARHKAYPLALRTEGGKRTLVVAFRDPHDEDAVREISRAARVPVKALIAPEFLILRFIERSYRRYLALELPKVRAQAPVVEVIAPKVLPSDELRLPDDVQEDLLQLRQLHSWLAGSVSESKVTPATLVPEEVTIELSEVMTDTVDVVR